MSRNGKSQTVAMRMHRSDYDILDRASAARDLPMSVFARRAVIAAAEHALTSGLEADGSRPLTLPERFADAERRARGSSGRSSPNDAPTAGAGRNGDTESSDAETVVLDLTSRGPDGRRR